MRQVNDNLEKERKANEKKSQARSKTPTTPRKR